jgi:hypothetical protein
MMMMFDRDVIEAPYYRRGNSVLVSISLQRRVEFPHIGF